jgi:hypothetical protein
MALLLILILPSIAYFYYPKKPVEHPPVNIPLEFPKTHLKGTLWRGGKYFAHRREGDTLIVEILSPSRKVRGENEICVGVCDKKTEFSVSNHNDSTFRLINFEEMCDWLDKNNSANLITDIALRKDKVTGYGALIPAKKYDSGIRFEWHKHEGQ